MQLPTIASVNPTIQPAAPAVSFNQAFLTMLHFYAPTVAGKWKCQINTRNFDAATGTLAPNTDANNHAVQIDDVAAYAAQYPLFAQTLGAVLVTAGLMQSLDAAQSAVANANSLADVDPTKPAALTVATAALATARVALGAAPAQGN